MKEWTIRIACVLLGVLLTLGANKIMTLINPVVEETKEVEQQEEVVEIEPVIEEIVDEEAKRQEEIEKEAQKKYDDMLKSDYNHAVAFNQIYISRTFDNLVRNKDLKAMNKLIKSDNKKMLTAFQAKFRTEFPEQQVQMQGNPQVQAQANQSATPQNTTPTTPQNNTSTTPAGPGMGGL